MSECFLVHVTGHFPPGKAAKLQVVAESATQAADIVRVVWGADTDIIVRPAPLKAADAMEAGLIVGTPRLS